MNREQKAAYAREVAAVIGYADDPDDHIALVKALTAYKRSKEQIDLLNAILVKWSSI